MTDATIINRAIRYLRQRLDVLIAIDDQYGDISPEEKAISDAIQILVRLPQYNFI